MSDLTIPNALTPGTPEDVSDVQDNFTAVATWANANIDGDNFTAATNQALGLSETGTIRRGKAIIATEEGRTNTAYGTLTTPDQVANIVLPTDGWIVVSYQAMWKESVNAAAAATIFLGANEIKAAVAGTAAPAAIGAICEMAANTYGPLVSAGVLGLYGGQAGTTATAYTGDVTTGQVQGAFFTTTQWVGGPTYIFAAAGTYTVSVQFKASSGTVTAKNRNLRVWTQAFG